MRVKARNDVLIPIGQVLNVSPTPVALCPLYQGHYISMIGKVLVVKLSVVPHDEASEV